MEKTWKPTTAGILCIVSGALNLIFAPLYLLYGNIFGSLFNGSSPYNPWMTPDTGAFLDIMIFIMTVYGAVSIATGIVSIVGGIFALRRRSWGLALAGALCALFPGVVFGVLAIIFLALSRREFERSNPSASQFS